MYGYGLTIMWRVVLIAKQVGVPRYRRTRVGSTPPSDRRVDVVHQVALVGGQQVHRFGGVDGRAAAHRDEPVPGTLLPGVTGGFVHAVVGGLDVTSVKDLRRDPVPGQRLGDARRDAEFVNPGIGEDQDPPGAVLGHLETDLIHGARAELQRRRAPGEDGLLDRKSTR